MPIPWNSDDPADQQQILQNSRRVLAEAMANARSRITPTVRLAQDWHRGLYAGCNLPVDYYAEEFRDSDPDLPELVDYEVGVGALRGVLARDVPTELSRFEDRMRKSVTMLDSQVGSAESTSAVGTLGSVLTLTASAHGEWVRIHPFANGNGRTARVWANWCLARYGLPPVVRLRQRPAGDAYAQAAKASMAGDHGPMVGVLNTMIRSRITAGS